MKLEEQDDILKQNTDFLKSMFQKAVFPCMLTVLRANINVFVDGILVANRIGADALAAVNLSLPLYLALCVIGSFLASGTAINAAREIGRNNSEESRRYYNDCVAGSFFASVIITVIGLVCREALVAFLCSDVSIRPYVREYVVITLIGALPKIMIYVPLWYLRLDGKNAAVTVMMSVMSVGNIVLDFLFVYVWDMGVFGAGLASVLATTAAFVIGFIRLSAHDCAFAFSPAIHKNPETWKASAAAGTPSALNNLFSTMRLLMINSMLMRAGGSAAVAVFTAVNGIAGFGECITLGVPQAASAMLGVYSGERDNGSCALLVKLEWIMGCIYAGIFFVLCMAGADVIQNMYGLQAPLRYPLFWMAAAVFPGLLCSILSGYYNMAKKYFWANGIIFFRVIVMTYIGLLFNIRLRLPMCSFLLFAECMTLVVWLFATGVFHNMHPEGTRYLLMDLSLEKSGNVLNFSVSSVAEEICSASERIRGFCAANGMDKKKTMRIQLAIEEIMTLITQVNEGLEEGLLKFDLRAYSLQGVSGIRIRYAGIAFNPFQRGKGENIPFVQGGQDAEDELYMGISMIQKMVEEIHYQRTFGVNTLQVLMREGQQGDGSN